MITIKKSVGQRGKNPISDLAKIQLALFSLNYLKKSDFENEMIFNYVSNSSNTILQNLTKSKFSFSQKLNWLPTGVKHISQETLSETIKSIKVFQSKEVGLRRPDGRIDPGGRSLRTLNKALKKLPKNLSPPENIPTPFNSGSTGSRIGSGNNVEIEGNNIVVKLSKNGNTETKKISIDGSRLYIVDNYNWNGIVKMLQFSYKKNKETYHQPTDLKGVEKDNLLIIPDEGICNVVKTQLAHQLKKTTAKNSSLKTILRGVDGKPGLGFINGIIGKKRSAFFDESKNKSFKNSKTNSKISIPSISDSENVLYDFFKNMTIIRNGLWSDNQRVVNIVGLRRVMNKMSRTKYNDGIAVCWKDENGNKKVELNIATTEPGNRSRFRQLTPQSITLVPGYHNIRQTAGRTRNAIKQASNAGKLTWCKGDTTMNFHQGGNRFDFPSKYWLTSYGIDGSVQTGFPNKRFNESQIFNVNVLLTEIFLLLSKYGANKKLPPYQQLKTLANSKSFKIEKIKNGIVSVSQKGVTQKREIDILKVKKWMVSYWYNKRLLPINKMKIFTIIQRLSSWDNKRTAKLEKLNKKEILGEIVDEFIIKIIETQMKYFPNLNDIDGKAGPIFWRVVENLRPSIEDAKKDFKKIEKLIRQLESLPFKNVKGLQLKFKKGLKINTDQNRENLKLHTRYNDVIDANVIETATVGLYSAGCQVIYDTEVFYEFWNKLLQKAKASGQRRWYYTLIDATGWKKTDVV